MKKPRWDFIFIDETGDPGPKGTSYYICTLLHVTDTNIHHLYSALCNFRFDKDYYHELHGHNISQQALLKINQRIKKQRYNFKCSVVYLDKNIYKGPYLNRFESKRNSVLFRKYVYKQVLDLHFKKYKLDSRKLEVVLDRSNLSEIDFDNLKQYLLRSSLTPKLDHLTDADSKYVELLQLADVLGAQFVPMALHDGEGQKWFAYDFINFKDISLESVLKGPY